MKSFLKIVLLVGCSCAALRAGQFDTSKNLDQLGSQIRELQKSASTMFHELSEGEVEDIFQSSRSCRTFFSAQR